MRYTHFAIIYLLLFLPIIAIGQKKKDHFIFHLGVRSISVYGDNPLVTKNTYLKPAVSVGLGINYQLSKNLQFQPEFRYNPRGYQSKYRLTDSTFLINSLSLHYIDICPNFNYTFGNINNKFRHTSVWGGPYIGIGLVGKNTLSGNILNGQQSRADSTFSRTTATFNDGLKRIDYGINVGFGLNLDEFTQFGVSYNMGFNNILSQSYSPIYNQSLEIYVRVLFDEMF